ncbi:MAG: RdgB/HAM1 family non-canonical purine NTP pyrophosphatase [Pirellulales bacterium]|nr:RdgB/HAM1 family non-canonical purine NTP pyrophosphatase [Pirellulales bacterium]
MLVIGTANRKKGLELADLIRPVGLDIQTLADFNDDYRVVENGESFAANACLKAAGYARRLDRWVLADDSGLAVDALDGRPGIFSARYASSAAGDEENNSFLLEQLGDMPLRQRTARFVCHVALSDPSGEIQARCEAACRGRIIFQPRGSEGFGYDPLFEIVEYHRTFAELGHRVKAVLSHRSRAICRLIPRLMLLADSSCI